MENKEYYVQYMDYAEEEDEELGCFETLEEAIKCANEFTLWPTFITEGELTDWDSAIWTCIPKDEDVYELYHKKGEMLNAIRDPETWEEDYIEEYGTNPREDYEKEYGPVPEEYEERGW